MERLTEPDDDPVAADWRCPECGRRSQASRFVPGSYIQVHGGDCSHNSALRVCDRCGFKHVERDFGQVLACVMDMSLEEGRALQQRIVDRLSR